MTTTKRKDIPKTNLPNTFLIGAPKAGTTSMAAYLSSHPNVFVCDPKEPNYWTREEPKEGEQAQTWDGYVNFYASATARQIVRVDASASYCWSLYAVPDILEVIPDARFIFMIRNPVELAPSLHSEEVLSGHENVHDYNRAWQLQNEREQGRSVPPTAECWQKVGYRFIGSLGSHLKRLLQAVPDSHLHTILFDDFVDDPGLEYRRVLKFLGLPKIEPSTYLVHNPAKHYLAPTLSRNILRPQGFLKPVALFCKRAMHQIGIRGLRSGLLRVFVVPGKASTPSEKTVSEMRSYFEPEIALLESLLGRDLSHWRAAHSGLSAASESKIRSSPVDAQT